MNAPSKRRKRRGRRSLWSLLVVSLAFLVAIPVAALASEVDVAVVDATAPTGSVELQPGESADIDINMTVTGQQDGTATFKVYRNWTLSEGEFTGSNPQEFTVGPRVGGAPATTFKTEEGTVKVAAGQLEGTFTLEVGAFDITNSNPQGAKLQAGRNSKYQVTVVKPSADKTPPIIEIVTPAKGGKYLLNEVVHAEYSVTDEGSGVARVEAPVKSGRPIDTASVGAKEFTVEAWDFADNYAKDTHNYSVVYDFAGFFRPIDNLPTLNRAKAGSAIPVKFSLNGNQGLDIFAQDFPKSGRIPTDPNAPVDPVEETVTAGSSSLSYDARLDQYTYVWKTEKAWAGQDRQLIVKFVDGQEKTADFRLTK